MPEKNSNKPEKEEILIYGAGGDPLKLIVQKTKPLFNLPYSLAEYKILDAYLSRINSHRPEGRTVVFPQGELERLLEVDRIRHEEMEKRLDTLLTTVTIKDPSEPRGINKLNLFSIARAIRTRTGNGKSHCNALTLQPSIFLISTLSVISGISCVISPRCTHDTATFFTYICTTTSTEKLGQSSLTTSSR